MQFNLGVETKVDDRTAYAIRMEICEELGKMEQTPFIMRLARAIKNGDLINDFYWENPIVFQTLKKHNVLMAPNCTFYRTDIKSVFAEFCEEIYSNRSKVKKVMLKREQELADLKANPDYDKAEAWRLESEISKLNNEQQALKIAMNSLN